MPAPANSRPALRVLRGQCGRIPPPLALILGSGLSEPELFRCEQRVPFSRLPGFPEPRVKGHRGEVALGAIGGVPLLLLSGRAHFYEGYSMAEVTFPVRALAEYGVQALLLTNAAGGINRSYRAGDFMGLTDHLNFMGVNPLRGWKGPGTGFTDLTRVYDPGLRSTLAAAATRAGLRWHEGVYLAVCGPTYETPAEIRAFRKLGADAVGMSTVPEAVVAVHCGLKVAGVSCITNPAAGRRGALLSHEAVLRQGRAMQERFEMLVGNFLTG